MQFCIALFINIAAYKKISIQMGIAEAIILAIVEGFTEFLPVSSTGHMIIASSLLGIQHDEFTKLFEVSIQFGAILAVVVLYGKKFFQFRNWQFYAKLIVGVIPALLLGFLFSDQIDKMLESPTVVAISLLIGGVVLMFIDKMFQKPKLESDDQISYGKAFTVGLFQTIAMIPGVSRSAASIIGGMSQRFTRNLAAEFSFFLAVPTLCAATGYKLLKAFNQTPAILQDYHNIITLSMGSAVAFIVALLAIKFFIGFLQKHGLKLFGWYRIIVGIALLIIIYCAERA